MCSSLALGLRMIRSPTNVLASVFVAPVRDFAINVLLPIVRVNDIMALAVVGRFDKIKKAMNADFTWNCYLLLD